MAELNERIELGLPVLQRAVKKYYKGSNCACQFPRFRQIAGIDCTDYGKSFKSWETTLLIEEVEPYFDIIKPIEGHDIENQEWTCKKCGSIFHFGWSDFSIHVERSKLSLHQLKVKSIGLPAQSPIPLFIGLIGHSIPDREEIQPVNLSDFEDYLLER